MAFVSSRAVARPRGICGRRWAPEPGEPFELIGHDDAMRRLFDILGPAESPTLDWERCRKHFPDDGSWRWVLQLANRRSPITDPELRTSLDSRWALLEKVFYAHDELKPFIRPVAVKAFVRPVEAWEWSCIGLHNLWSAWANPAEGVRADLTPAQLSFDCDGEDGEVEAEAEESEQAYEVYFPLQYLLRFAMAHRGTNGFSRSWGSTPAGWKGTLEVCASFCRLGSGDGAADLFDRLARSQLATRRGRWVEIVVESGKRETVRTSTFCGRARQVLG